MGTILVVKNEERIASLITKGLRATRFIPTITASSRETIQFGLMGDFGFIILDLELPDIDGLDVLEELREQEAATSIVTLTACSSVVDRVAGLENSADDYMAKPFSCEELLARIRLRLRDSASASQSSTATTTLSYGNLTLDYRTRQITVDERVIDLSAREFILAEMFPRNLRQVFNREQLLFAVQGMDFDPGSNIVDVCMLYLRSKLGEERFKMARGMGHGLLWSPSRSSSTSPMSSS